VFGGVTVTSAPPSGAEKARLLRRVQAVARLRHPNLVRMLPLPGGAGLAPVLGNARRLADFTLPAGTFKRFDLEQVVRLLLDVLSGLAALHEVVTDGQAFVHGDVSPQNIYIDEHGTARLVPLLNAHSTSGVPPENPGYAALERRSGALCDARADVFSVGVMLWEALAGKRWHDKPEPLRLAANLRWAQPLCAIAEQATAHGPGLRFRSALELSNAMAAAVAQQLSRVDVDAWQEEAPTPVFQPRLHLAKLRTSTPPPAVLTIAEPSPPPSVEATRGPLATKRRVARVVVPALATLIAMFVLGALGNLGVLAKPGRLVRHQVAAGLPVVTTPPPVMLATPAPLAAGVPPVSVALPSAVASISPPRPSSARAAAAHVSPPPARPSKQVVPKTPPAASKAKPKRRASDSDYGI
jgi:serine/threonine protein kinase